MLTNFYLYFDSAINYQTGFQDPASPIMESIIDLHHDIMGALIFIGVWVFWMLLKIVVIFRVKKDQFNNAIRDEECPLGVTLLRIRHPIDFTHDTKTEFIWTVLPTLLLILISGPSLSLLYAVEESAHAAICIKCIGHQWYWSYSYRLGLNLDPEGEAISFDSYMVNEDDLVFGHLRLLEVDNRLIVPTNVQIRLHLTSDDVLHSWSVPSLGVKTDACPGRLNAIDFFIRRNGVFYGQCSEICGVNHAFMPIVVQSFNLEKFMTWIEDNQSSELVEVSNEFLEDIAFFGFSDSLKSK